MAEVSTGIWLIGGIVFVLLALVLLSLAIWWRRRRVEQFRRWNQLDSVHNARERRVRGD